MAQIRNLDLIRSWKSTENGAWGQRIYESLRDFLGQFTNLSQQVNGNGSGQPQAPHAINSVSVAAQNGHFSVAIQDTSEVYRGINYFIEHADNPAFTNPQIEHIGTSRNATFFFGSATRYWRAYSAYPGSPPSPPVYFGGSAQPTAVSGGGEIGPPAFQAAQGSGTGAAGTGLSGFGPIPFRSSTGAPPIR